MHVAQLDLVAGPSFGLLACGTACTSRVEEHSLAPDPRVKGPPVQVTLSMTLCHVFSSPGYFRL